jgi:hypothetical protein
MMTIHACDLCGSEERELIPESAKFGSGGVYVCLGCGFVYVPKRRSSAEIAQAWNDIFGEGYTSRWPMVEARLRYVAEYCEQNFGWKGKDVFEIGAGEGRFLDIVKEYGTLWTRGLEPSDVAAGQAIRHCNYEDFGTTKKYDVVCILWTLENCTDCIGMLKKARELLKLDGHLVVATGSRIFVPFKKPLSSYFSDNAPDTHCFRWSARSLAAAIMKAGFGACSVNDYTQSDWMVVIADTKAVQPNIIAPDNPTDVLEYFQAWGQLFP